MDDPDKEAELASAMVRLMRENDAPEEQFLRMGLPKDGNVTREMILQQREIKSKYNPVAGLEQYQWEERAKWQFAAFKNVASPFMTVEEVEKDFKQYMKRNGKNEVGKEEIFSFAREALPEEVREAGLFTLEMAARLR